MNLEKINELTAQDMAGVNATILEQLNSDVQLINQLGYYIISGGGKRIRPMIAVLAARAVGYQGNAHVTIAALIEFIHTATLLHDDVVDESDMRRGKATANAAFGNAASVLVGDFIYTRAFQMMTSLGSLKVLEVMSEAVNVIAEGEVLQLMNVNDPDITEENYMRVIYSKTARLFEAAAQCSGIPPVVRLSKRKGCRTMAATLVRLSSSLTICWITVPTASISVKMWVMTSMRANLPYRCFTPCATVRQNSQR